MGTVLVSRNCPHKVRVSTSGPYTIIEARIRAAETSRCRKCEELLAARRKSRFCPLWGEEDRAIEADHIRRQAYHQANVLYMGAINGRDRPLYARMMDRITEIGDAEWWLDHRNDALSILAQQFIAGQ